MLKAITKKQKIIKFIKNKIHNKRLTHKTKDKRDDIRALLKTNVRNYINFIFKVKRKL
ncbi:MAG: hypothetical protein LBQ24_04310 [Candidatus Peribacteria bacterium]|jgi:hypothetical protein|nr:hypothetical protein [Candidatus Peribacteria bacterium]